MTTELAIAINILSTTYKNAKSLIDKTNNLEIKGIIVDMGGQILDLEMAIREKELENEELKAELNKLKTVTEREMVLGKYGYHDKNTNEGPFCPDCYNNYKKTITLSTGYPLDNLLICNNCKRTVKK
jgi:hypothetical protein